MLRELGLLRPRDDSAWPLHKVNPANSSSRRPAPASLFCGATLFATSCITNATTKLELLLLNRCHSPKRVVLAFDVNIAIISLSLFTWIVGPSAVTLSPLAYRELLMFLLGDPSLRGLEGIAVKPNSQRKVSLL